MIIWTLADAVPLALGVAYVAVSLLFAFAAPWSSPRYRRANRRSAR